MFQLLIAFQKFMSVFTAWWQHRLHIAFTITYEEDHVNKTGGVNKLGHCRNYSLGVLGSLFLNFKYECWFLLEAIRRTIKAADSVPAVRSRWRSFSRESVPQAAADQH